jgi:ribonuclease III
MSLSDLESKLGGKFKNPRLLKQAVTHASVGYEAGRKVAHNERLEFLGDAALGLVISRLLFERFPEAAEGRLTKMRSHLANRAALLQMAEQIDLGKFLVLGGGEEQSGGRSRPSNLANAMEAVIGAVYLDRGVARAEALVTRLLSPRLKEVLENPEPLNAKGLLQEKLQAEGAELPVYRITALAGPDHQRQFEAVVEWRSRPIGRGTGPSKKAAEQKAAEAALSKLGEKK